MANDNVGGLGGSRPHKPTTTKRQAVSVSVGHEPRSAADLAFAIVSLIAELRPDIPLPVIASLVVETLDLAACTILDGEWAEARQALWPEAIKLAHSRHTASYAERRAREWADVRPDELA
jgi:hypothetical protein